MRFLRQDVTRKPWLLVTATLMERSVQKEAQHRRINTMLTGWGGDEIASQHYGQRSRHPGSGDTQAGVRFPPRSNGEDIVGSADNRALHSASARLSPSSYGSQRHAQSSRNRLDPLPRREDGQSQRPDSACMAAFRSKMGNGHRGSAGPNCRRLFRQNRHHLSFLEHSISHNDPTLYPSGVGRPDLDAFSSPPRPRVGRSTRLVKKTYPRCWESRCLVQFCGLHGGQSRIQFFTIWPPASLLPLSATGNSVIHPNLQYLGIFPNRATGEKLRSRRYRNGATRCVRGVSLLVPKQRLNARSPPQTQGPNP